MPMIDAVIPAGALSAEQESRLVREVTEALIRREGLDPDSSAVREVSVLYLHRPSVFVGGEPASAPRYRFVPAVPEGQYTEATRAEIVDDITRAVARAENRSYEAVAARVWVFPIEVPDGQWGARGRILRLPEILDRLGKPGERESGLRRLARGRAMRWHQLLMAWLAPLDRHGG